MMRWQGSSGTRTWCLADGCSACTWICLKRLIGGTAVNTRRGVLNQNQPHSALESIATVGILGDAGCCHCLAPPSPVATTVSGCRHQFHTGHANQHVFA